MVFVQIVDEYSVTRCTEMITRTEMMGQRMHSRTEMIWQRFQMPWISSNRILHYSLGHDFTNTIDLYEKFEEAGGGNWKQEEAGRGRRKRKQEEEGGKEASGGGKEACSQ